VHWFQWMGQEDIPAVTDLRRCGWRLRAMPTGDGLPEQADSPLLVERAALTPYRWRLLMAANRLGLRRWTLVVGIADAAERVRLLAKGFGDVLPPDMPLVEVQARARRVAEQALFLPRWRKLAGLSLDLLQREAFYHHCPLGLHPREFLLLWRLMEAPGKPVEKRDLLRDVWHLSHVPETNSVAVHASRLRSKMAAGGLEGWVQSTPGGGYSLVPASAGASMGEGISGFARKLPA